MTQAETNPRTPKVNPQTQQWVVLAVLGAALLAGAGLVYWFVFDSSPRSRTITVDPATQTPTKRQTYAAVPGVTRNGTADWSIRGQVGGVRMKRQNDGKYDMDYWFVSGFSPAMEKPMLIGAAVRATRDDAMAKEWKITPAQQKDIRSSLAKVTSPKLSGDDRETITKAFTAYLSANDPSTRMDLQKKLLAQVDEIVKAKIESANAALDQKIQELHRILSSEQIDKMVKKG